MKQGLLPICAEITLGKYQEQLLNLEKKLESGLYCELTDKELKASYVEYTLLYDTIANRISIEDVQTVMPDVYYKKEDMLACIDHFYEEMMKHSEDMKLMENYRAEENYAYLGLPTHFLIFDEHVAFMEMLGTKENAAVLDKLKQIVMLGRQSESAGGVRSKSRRNGLTCCGWCAARHASITPSYLTEGYKSTDNNQTGTLFL